MRLSSLAISKISVRAKNRLALELGCSVQTIERWIKQNEDNGNLTKVTALEVIQQETGLSDQEILEEESEKVS